MKIKQFTKNGKPVMNHFVLEDEKTGVRYFQSYNSIIVKLEKGKITLGRDWKASVTTSKHRNVFLGESTKETQTKLDSGEYLYDENLGKEEN